MYALDGPFLLIPSAATSIVTMNYLLLFYFLIMILKRS